MKKRDHRRDAGVEQRVHELVVEIEALRVDSAHSFGQDSRPRNREPIGFQPEFFHQCHIVTPTSVMIAGHVARLATLGLPWRVTKPMPDAFPSAVRQWRTLDLIRRRGRSPEEALRKQPRVIVRRGWCERGGSLQLICYADHARVHGPQLITPSASPLARFATIFIGFATSAAGLDYGWRRAHQIEPIVCPGTVFDTRLESGPLSDERERSCARSWENRKGTRSHRWYGRCP